MAKKVKNGKKSEVKINRSDVVKAAVEGLKKMTHIAGAKVASVKVEDGSKILWKLDNGFTARARVKAGKTK